MRCPSGSGWDRGFSQSPARVTARGQPRVDGWMRGTEMAPRTRLTARERPLAAKHASSWPVKPRLVAVSAAGWASTHLDAPRLNSRRTRKRSLESLEGAKASSGVVPGGPQGPSRVGREPPKGGARLERCRRRSPKLGAQAPSSGRQPPTQGSRREGTTRLEGGGCRRRAKLGPRGPGRARRRSRRLRRGGAGGRRARAHARSTRRRGSGGSVGVLAGCVGCRSRRAALGPAERPWV